METTAYSFEIATLAFSRPMWLLVEKKHDFPRAPPGGFLSLVQHQGRGPPTG